MKERILQEIMKYETIIIHRHVRPDPDAYGSQCGLAEILKASFPTKNIYVTGASDPSLEFLYKMDEIDDAIYHDALVIVCDTANEARVSDQRYKNGKFIIKIDHHPNEDPYGDLLWVETSASSTSEMIYELYIELKDSGLTMTKEAARLIYAGIVGDTGRFLFPNTTQRTLQYASELVQADFSFTDLYQGMYKTKLNVARLQGYVLNNFTFEEEGIAYIIITKDILREYNATPSEASQLVGLLGNIDGVKAWVFFVEEESLIRVRLRSKGPVINGVARNYNGGGHPLASGASIYQWSDVQSVLNDLRKVCQE